MRRPLAIAVTAAVLVPIWTSPTRAETGSGFRLPQRFFIAHRASGSFLEPENTASAFEAGIRDPDADLLEFDVQVLKDGVGGVWHDLTVDRISSERGRVNARTSRQFTKLRIDAHSWFGGTAKDTHPLLLDEVLAKYAPRKQLLAHPKDSRAARLVIRHVVARHLTGRVQMQTDHLADAVAARKAGITAQLLIGTDAQARATSPSQVRKAGIQRVSVNSLLSDALIARYVREGLVVACFNVESQTRRDRLYRLGVRGIDTDDPVYLHGSRYRRTSDPFATGTYWPGHMGQAQTAAAMGLYQRGRFTAPGWWTIPYGRADLFTRQGWATLGRSYSLRATVRFDRLSARGADAAAIQFSSPTDDPYAAQTGGYDLALRQNGSLDLYKDHRLLASVRTPAITRSGTTANVTVTVAPWTITVRREGSRGVTVSDTSYRGQYLYLGRIKPPGHDGPQLSFRDIAVE
ncbi:glycerophosphodiester phosphodiesterase [Actinomadura oligospora]|uniref:glycerophosphodiester phosphodiesterase n=1 Tax=Actinomadura oligospora TaxID=111804 RepID=UPI0004797F7D|nr:glycerophosphodiester phosphodiesterase family protein [Actinomadura oligospora]